MINKFYIYRHIRLDKNEVFYIGKGSKLNNATCFNKEYVRAFSTQGRNIIWRRIVNKTDYEVEIMFESNDEKEIFQKETELIEFYGRKDLGLGTLVNLTDGGEGCGIGKIVSEETRKKISAANKGKKFSPEVNAKKGSKGEKNYFYGTTQCRKKVRLNQIEQSTPVEVIDKDGNRTIYECTRDVADAFNVDISTVKDRIISDAKGKYSIRGIFAGYKLKRLV